MDALDARYPFFEAAREAVREAGVDLAEVVADDAPVVERATERVRTAIEDRTVGDPHSVPRIELLSYPVARVLVSLVEDPRLTRRYARAEAETAIRRLAADLDASDRRSTSRPRPTLPDALREFDLDDRVGRLDDDAERPPRPDDAFGVEVATYLDLAGDLDGESWRLVNRTLAAGTVTVTREELYDLLREAIRDRVEDGLPVSVPEGVAEALSGPVADLRERLSDARPDRDIDAVEPALFPPCVTALLERAAEGETLPDHSRFALTAFLATIGMDEDEIADRYPEADEGAIRSQVARLREDGEPAAYPPPSCVTMEAYGDCVNTDALCDRISHPLDYYGRRLDGAEP